MPPPEVAWNQLLYSEDALAIPLHSGKCREGTRARCLLD